MNCFPSSDYIKSFRGKKPKKFDSAIVRQIDENFSVTNNQNPITNDDMPVCEIEINIYKEFFFCCYY